MDLAFKCKNPGIRRQPDTGILFYAKYLSRIGEAFMAAQAARER